MCPSAVRSLYNWSRSLVRIAGNKPDLFPMHVGLWQGCPLSLVLFNIFMDRISRHSQGQWVWFGSHWISSLLFADDVVLLAPWARTSSMSWGGLQTSVKQVGWESAPPSLRPWFSTGKRWRAEICLVVFAANEQENIRTGLNQILSNNRSIYMYVNTPIYMHEITQCLKCIVFTRLTPVILAVWEVWISPWSRSSVLPQLSIADLQSPVEHCQMALQEGRKSLRFILLHPLLPWKLVGGHVLLCS